jgi:transposase
MSKRRKYSEGFQREAVKLTRQPGVTASQVARDIGVEPGLLGRWRRAMEGQDEPFSGSGVARDQASLTLKRELAKV